MALLEMRPSARVVLFACLLTACSERTSPPAQDTTSLGDGGERALEVKLDRKGIVQIGGTRLLLDEHIESAFRAFHERAPRAKILIVAHRATLHGRLVRIVELAKEAGTPFDIVVVDQ